MKKLILQFILFFTIGCVDAKSPILTQKQLKRHPPRVTRTCCAFGTNLKIAVFSFIHLNHVIDFTELGEHHYLGHKNEGNGILYSQKGGFIDLGHVREWADWTAFLFLQIQNNSHDSIFYKKLGNEGGMRHLQLNNVSELDLESKIKLAGKIAFDLSYWHEIATGYGVSAAPFISEKFSSFSPEDMYSNILGIEIGMQAIRSSREYDKAVTNLLNEKLITLQVVKTIEETYAAFDNVESIWWSRDYNMPNNRITLRRNYFESNCIVPWLLPNQKPTNSPDELEVPLCTINDAALSKYYSLVINANYKIPIHKVLHQHSGRKIKVSQFDNFANDIKNTLSN